MGPTAVVDRGPLIVSVTEAGELEAERQKIISNELSWPVIIRELVDEGTLVKEGDTIIEFECKELLDAIAQQEIHVTQARNSHTQASQDLELTRKETANAVAKAKQAVIDANLDEKKYLEREFAITRSQKNAEIALAEGNLTLAEAKLEFMNKANADPELEEPYSANEIEAQKIEVDRLKLEHEKATSELEMLDTYDHPRRLRDLKTGISDAQMALERAELEHRNKILIGEADTQAKKHTFDMRKEKLTEYREDEKKLVVKAEKAGLVVYDTGRRHWQSQVRIAVGEKITPKQQLMVIPEMETLQIKTKVYEAVIDQVTAGVPAHISLDAKPGLRLTGKVTKVAPLPDSQNRWLNPGVKVFDVIVKLDEPIEGLKPGMTAQVELVLAELADVLSLPVAAIFTEQDKTFCYRVNSGRCEEAPVKLGRMNDRRVEIVSGLKEGDKVLLSPPPEMPGEEREEAPEAGPPPGAEADLEGASP